MSVLLLVLPLSVPWALALLHLEDLPVYIDSVQAIGAGAELAYNGHFSSTWMLYGLINPFLLEALLRVGFGSAACSIFRLFQLFWLALGVLGIVLTLRKLLAASAGGFRTAFLAIIPVVLGSTVLLIESLELTPEAIGFCAMSWLLLACVSYDGSMKSTEKLALAIAFLIGTRPTGLMLVLPVALCVAGHAGSESWMRRFWTPGLLILMSAQALSAGFVGRDSRIVTILILAASGAALSVVCMTRDLVKRDGMHWMNLIRIAAISAAVVLIAFPHYLIYAAELKRQISRYFLDWASYAPCGSIRVIAVNLFVETLNLSFLFPGILGTVGFFAGIVLLVRRRIDAKHLSSLSLFALGLVPFALNVSALGDLQIRYLIPLMPVVILMAGYGLRSVIADRWMLLLAVPLAALSILETSEVGRFKTYGGTLNALVSLGDYPGASVYMDCGVGLYGLDDEYLWVLAPFVENIESVSLENEGISDLLILNGTDAPEGYSVIRTWERTHDPDFEVFLKSKVRSSWEVFWIMRSHPWFWRESMPVTLCRRAA